MKTSTHKKMMMSTLAAGLAFAASHAAFAGDARTSASAGSNGRGPGSAAATAEYDGNGIGFTKTKAASGKLNIARGLAVGFDEDGLDLSHSYALAPKYGPAFGGTFNMHIGADGRGSIGVGNVSAGGDRERAVSVGGSTGGSRGERPATVWASGTTGPRGTVRASTYAESRESYRGAHMRPVSARGHLRPVGR
jgi:hypothetical protein